MFHLAAYSAVVGPTANTEVAALSDDVLDRPNNHFRLPSPMNLLAAWGGGANLTRARLDSAILRQINNPYLTPVNVGVIPVTLSPIIDYTANPFRLPAGEEIAAQVTDSTGTTEQVTVLIAVGDTPDPIPPGDIIRVYVTSTTAAVANAWTTIALTFNASLPAGIYAIVGSYHRSTNAIAHRFMIPQQVWRPGQLSSPTLSIQPPLQQQQRFLGTYGRFRADFLPQMQVLVNGTDAAHEVYLDLVKVGSY